MEDEEGDQKVKLGLGIGVGCNYGDDDHHNGIDEVGVVGQKKKKQKKCGGGGFTAAQLLELEQQAFIYKHLTAALPVPFHLLLPIWNSVAASLGPLNADSMYKQFPSFIGFSPLGFDYRHKMDPEPGRCRRTDGKKWRCSRNVVPDEKYCEQHIHRGRQRSRKPVENSEVASPSCTKTPKKSEGELWNSKTSLQISTPKSLQLLAQSCDDSNDSQCPTTASSGYQECEKKIGSITTTPIANMPANRTPIAAAGSVTPTSIGNIPANRTPTTIAGPTAATNGRSNENNLNIVVTSNSSNHAGDNYMIRGSSNNRNNFNVGSNLSPALGFSPKSVLQGRRMSLLGGSGVYFDSRSGEELEPGRCRRTDGKKWRCRREVLPDQKYCGRHVHRGAKRQMTGFQPVAVPSTSAAAMNTARLSQTTSVPEKTDCAVPNTNLSMSIPASAPLIQNDEKSKSSSDSDTTISDTSLTAYESGYVSS